MKKLIKLTSIVFALLCLFVLGSCKSEDKLYVAVSPDAAPYQFIDETKRGQEQYAGAEIELAKYIANELNMTLVLKGMGTTEVLSALSNGEVDLAINQITFSTSRKYKYSISEESYHIVNGKEVYVFAQLEDVELIEKVNNVIAKVNSEGLFDKWMQEAKTLYTQLGDKAVEKDMTVVLNLFQKIGKIFTNYFGEFMKGLGITIALSLVSVIFAALLGALLCLMNISNFKILKVIATTYIEIIRGIPLLLQLTVIFLLMPAGMPKFVTCVVALVINSGAYQAEIFRAGIQAVDNGQMEAARSLGMSYPQAMIKVILPQAIKNILPSLANEFVALIKETSLASTFYVGDLMTVKTVITAVTYDALTPYIIIAIIYFIITFSLSKLIKYIEKKVAY